MTHQDGTDPRRGGPHREPTFTELLDLVEGRLDDDRAAEVAGRAGESADATATLAWQRKFLEAADEMPLSAPPPRVAQAARAAFDAAFDDDGYLGLDLAHDSRWSPAVAGVRDSGSSDTFHLTYRSYRTEDPDGAEGTDGRGRVVVEIDGDGGQGADVLLHGTVTCEDGTAPAGRPVVLRSGGELRRTVALDSAGGFQVRVPRTVDELRVDLGRARLRAALDLGGTGDTGH